MCSLISRPYCSVLARIYPTPRTHTTHTTASGVEQLFDLAHVELPQLAARLVAESAAPTDGPDKKEVDSSSDDNKARGTMMMSHLSLETWAEAVEKFRALADSLSPQLRLPTHNKRTLGDASWWCNNVSMAWITCATAIARVVDALVMNMMMRAPTPGPNQGGAGCDCVSKVSFVLAAEQGVDCFCRGAAFTDSSC
jgi:hypothetical protein